MKEASPRHLRKGKVPSVAKWVTGGESNEEVDLGGGLKVLNRRKGDKTRENEGESCSGGSEVPYASEGISTGKKSITRARGRGTD